MEEQLRQAFIAYLTANNYKENTVFAYARGIDTISRHISEIRGNTISLYDINIARDLERLKRIRDSFGLQGNFSETGKIGNGTIRNSINRFVEFRERQNTQNINGVKNKAENKVENEGQEIGVPVTSTHRRIMAYEDFNELKQMVESLKRKVQETNSTTKLIKTVVVFQVITLILVLYTLLQS